MRLKSSEFTMTLLGRGIAMRTLPPRRPAVDVHDNRCVHVKDGIKCDNLAVTRIAIQIPSITGEGLEHRDMRVGHNWTCEEHYR